MKMILAIIHPDDANIAINSLMQEGYHVTKLATTGGFLRAGNTTILLGTEDERVEHATEIIKENPHSRMQVVPSTGSNITGLYPPTPVEVPVGGATLFILNVEQFERV